MYIFAPHQTTMIIKTNKINSRTVIDVLSLYEFSVYFVLFVLFIATNNIYFVILFLALFSKQIPERILKRFVSHKYNKRPSDAVNCNMINKGGDASRRGGFPSGHSTVSSFVATYLVFLFIMIKKNNRTDHSMQTKITQLMIFALLFAIIMPVIRFLNHCHTLPQVLAGFIFGIIFAIGFIFFEQYVLLKWPLYINHRNKIWK